MNAVGQPGRGLIGRGDADVTEEATRILIREVYRSGCKLSSVCKADLDNKSL